MIFFFAHPLCASLSCLQYGISFGNMKPDNVDRDYIVLLSNIPYRLEQSPRRLLIFGGPKLGFYLEQATIRV